MALTKKSYGYKPKRYSRSFKARVNRLEYLMSVQRPELKVKSDSFNLLTLASGTVHPIQLTNIASGTTNVQRIGNEINLFDCNVQMYSNTYQVDFYLVLSRNGQPPIYDDFMPVPGGHIKTDFSNGNEFVTLVHWAPRLPRGSFVKKLNNIRTKYNSSGGTAATVNALYLICKNDSGSAVHVSAATKLRYLDN